jgi:MoaA/NifB/PqqE/SkfB family radical SAM enzyme
VADSETVCMLPWLHRFTDEQGYHKLCCSADGDAGNLRHANGTKLHVLQGLTDAQVLNSPDLKEIRLAMMRGEWPRACDRCRRDEAAGSVSMRNYMDQRFGRWKQDALRDTRPSGALEHPAVRYADIRLGNVCNLTCRMCGPQASRLWADLHNAVRPQKYLLAPEVLTAFRDENWVKSQPVQWLMEQCLPAVESLHFAGGEPLIIPEMVELLERCVQSGRAKDIDLSYNTNMTVLPEKVTRLWPHFRSTSLVCSIDGIGKLNDYIRRPSKWSAIENNLRLVDANFKAWNLRVVSINVTVQIYNILQLNELFDYFATGFEHISAVPGLTALYYPEYLSIKMLPAAARKVARQRLEEVRQKIELGSLRDPADHLKSIDRIIAFMEEPCPPGHWAEFLSFSQKSDREFGDSWLEMCPELAKEIFPRTLVQGAGQQHG